MKRITAFVMAVIMAFCVLSETAFAYSDYYSLYAGDDDKPMDTYISDKDKKSKKKKKYTCSRTMYADSSQSFYEEFKWLGKKIRWKSLDTSILKVTNKGVVTAIKKGTAKIVAKASNGKRIVLTVTVLNPAYMSIDNCEVSCDTSLGITPYFTRDLISTIGGAAGYYVSYYDRKKKDWIKLYSTQTVLDDYYYCFAGLTPDTEYYFKLSFYRFENGKVRTVRSYVNSLRTESARPHINKFKTIKNGKALSVGWTTAGDWDGYEIEYTRYLKGYAKTGKKKYIKTGKTKLKSSNCIISTSPDDEDIIVTVRAYKNKTVTKKNKKGKKVKKTKKEWSGYSRTYRLDSMEYIIDNYIEIGTPGKVYGDLDNKLVNAMLSACIKKGLTPYEKVRNIHYYISRVGDYEYDYDKIDPDPLKALIINRACQCYSWAAVFKIFMDCAGFKGTRIVGGTKHGANHWWNEIDMNGVTYLEDPYYGSWFLTTYPEGGYFTKIYG